MKYYRYVEPNGESFTGVINLTNYVLIRDGATAQDLLIEVLAEDPPNLPTDGRRGAQAGSVEQSRTYLQCNVYASTSAILEEDVLPTDTILGDHDDMGTWSQPLLIVPQIYTKAAVQLMVK